MAYERSRRQKFSDKFSAQQIKEVTLDGSNPTPVTMDQLKVVKFAMVTPKGTSAPGLEAEATCNWSGGDNIVNVYGWAHTSNANPTLIASTNNSRVFVVFAVGSAR